MPWWTLAALIFLGAVLAAGAVFATLAGIKSSRLMRRGEALALAGENLAARAEALEARLAEVQERSEEVERHVAHLERSLNRFGVLAWALGDAQRTVSRLRAAARK